MLTAKSGDGEESERAARGKIPRRVLVESSARRKRRCNVVNQRKLILCAIDALKKQRRRIAFEASVGRTLGGELPPEILDRMREYELLTQSIAFFEAMMAVQ